MWQNRQSGVFCLCVVVGDGVLDIGDTLDFCLETGIELYVVFLSLGIMVGG